MLLFSNIQFFPEANEVDFARRTFFEATSFKLDYLTKPSLFQDFGFVSRVKMSDRVKPEDELFLVAYPYFNVNEMLVVEELYEEAVMNTTRKLIIFNGELDRIRSGCILPHSVLIPPFFLDALTLAFRETRYRQVTLAISMDSAASSMSSSSSVPIKMSDTAIPPQLKFLMTNVKAIINTQLTPNNYFIWKSQILKLFTANGLDGYLDGTAIKLQKQILIAEGSVSINPHYQTWLLVDQNLSAALYSTISPSLLPYVLNLDCCHDIWMTIERRLQSTNCSRQLQLKSELHQLQKGDKTMVQYLSEIKQKVDAITAAGSTIDPQDILLYTLNGLPPAYNAIKTTIRTQLNPISLDNFYSLLYSEELNLHSELVAESTQPPIDTAFASQTLHYPSFFYPKLASLTKTFLPKLETVYYIHNFKGRNGGTLFRSYPGAWQVLRKQGDTFICLHQQEEMPSLKEVALEILPSA
ncbi:hypothetical protein IEQ34_000611 [Dendrobium chrysotoxum]|uniref:DUF1995 domain-containing protein n=1 Tax=Dendrobium chrysotoxum TaxID=161865 RepID=A0AAV7HTF3_DENCH|nr:hypothetical protein IEQ34_000611 [Dendrobium chrysotoxum]